MEYLLIDAHQRFLGMMRSDREFAVGDSFQAENLQMYTVVGVNWSNQRISGLPSGGTRRQSLTVVSASRSMQNQTLAPA